MNMLARFCLYNVPSWYLEIQISKGDNLRTGGGGGGANDYQWRLLGTNGD